MTSILKLFTVGIYSAIAIIICFAIVCYAYWWIKEKLKL